MYGVCIRMTNMSLIKTCPTCWMASQLEKINDKDRLKRNQLPNYQSLTSILVSIPKVPGQHVVPFFRGESDEPNIRRHPENNRRQEKTIQEYCKSVQERGIARGVRGEPWLRAPNPDAGEDAYYALTFATLMLCSALYPFFER